MLRGRNRLWLVFAAAFAASAGTAHASGLALSPAPGTPDASPGTQISILGVEPARIRAVGLTGTVSGVHRGRLRRYSHHRRASFVPATQLKQGESAQVVVRLRGRSPIRYSFTVARPAPPQPALNLNT